MHVPHPRRAVLGGDRFHPNLPAGAIYAGREAPYLKRSPFANPHPIGWCKACHTEHDRAEAIALYQQHLDEQPHLVHQAAAVRTDARLACRCPLDQPCHVDVLLARVDQHTTEVTR